MNGRISTLQYLLIGIVGFLLTSCSENKADELLQCSSCSKVTISDTIAGDTLIFQKINPDSAVFFSFEYEKFYSVCNPEILQEVDSYQALRIKGSLHSSCEQVPRSTPVSINSFEMLESCTQVSDTTSQTIDLYNTWEVIELETGGETIRTPCELLGAYLDITKSESKGEVLAIITGVNAFTIDIETSESQTLLIEGCLSTEARGQTAQARRFESAIRQSLCDGNTSLEYTIENNFLTLINHSNEFTIKCQFSEK